MALGPCLFWICQLSKTKNSQPMTVSTQMVRIAKSRPRKNQSERLDSPCHIINVMYYNLLLVKWPWHLVQLLYNKQELVYHQHVLNVKVWFWSDISKSDFKTKSNQAITFIGFGFTAVCDQLSSLVIGK